MKEKIDGKENQDQEEQDEKGGLLMSAEAERRHAHASFMARVHGGGGLFDQLARDAPEGVKLAVSVRTDHEHRIRSHGGRVWEEYDQEDAPSPQSLTAAQEALKTPFEIQTTGSAFGLMAQNTAGGSGQVHPPLEAMVFGESPNPTPPYGNPGEAPTPEPTPELPKEPETTA